MSMIFRAHPGIGEKLCVRGGGITHILSYPTLWRIDLKKTAFIAMIKICAGNSYMDRCSFRKTRRIQPGYFHTDDVTDNHHKE